MAAFRTFVIVISILVCALFTVAQWMMNPGVVISWINCRFRRTARSDNAGSSPRKSPRKSSKRKLRFRQVVRDFWAHDNFRAWIGMEMLLEGQHNFMSAFLKTFVDRLVADAGVPRESCDWLSVTVASPQGSRWYPMLRSDSTHGLPKGVHIHVPCEPGALRTLFTMASPSHPYLIVMFLLIHTVMTGAVQSAGFHLAMSDMVLEMKRNHAGEGRFDEPSLAGLFMGANACCASPWSLSYPLWQLYFLGETDFSTNEQSEGRPLGVVLPIGVTSIGIFGACSRFRGESTICTPNGRDKCERS